MAKHFKHCPDCGHLLAKIPSGKFGDGIYCQTCDKWAAMVIPDKITMTLNTWEGFRKALQGKILKMVKLDLSGKHAEEVK